MSHRLGTFCAVNSSAKDHSTRWRLERAGIVNVYQYGNETLDFADGRLLLRGVNGSGKSTAMNMLLPFLLTASQRNIDAAQDQRGLLASWMLTGREDSQPVGYLWVEFRRGEEFFACGCGIRARRQENSVTTWWFATAKRPGIDVELVEDNIPLPAEVLRERLDGDPVFGERDRREYRRLIEHRLFGGASLDHHVRLLDKVRSPRVGDRIDHDLPRDLMDALPHLSEKALADAAAPLDDLEEHRRNVTELERTVSALDGLLERYRSYCVGDALARISDGRGRLRELGRHRREAARLNRQASQAGEQVRHNESQIEESEHRIDVLRSEIGAIEESRAYRDGRQLEAVRQLVDRLHGDASDAEQQAARAAQRREHAVEELRSAERRSDDENRRLKELLAEALVLAAHCAVSERPPAAVELRRSRIEGLDACHAPEAPEASEAQRCLSETGAAVQQRHKDVGLVEAEHLRVARAEAELERAEDALRMADDALDQASARWEAHASSLAEVEQRWARDVRQWLRGAAQMFPADTAAEMLEAAEPLAVSPDGRTEMRARVLGVFEAVVKRQHDAVAADEQRYRALNEEAADQQAAYDELMGRTEPPPPRLAWQSPGAFCLADVIEFASGVQPDEQAGLEAALEASGLLSARPAVPGRFELATGELVAIGSTPAGRPLSTMIEVAVPAHLADQVDTAAIVGLLASIGCVPNCADARGPGHDADASSNAQPEQSYAIDAGDVAVGTDGTFRLGALAGRHRKEQAEFIGAAARSAALERARAEALEDLRRLGDEIGRVERRIERQKQRLDELRGHRDAFAPTGELEHAEGAVEAAAAERAEAQARKNAAADAARTAEQTAGRAGDELHRVAASLSLPRDRGALAEVAAALRDLVRLIDDCGSRLRTLQSSVDEWDRCAQRVRAAVSDCEEANGRLRDAASERDRQQARLDTLLATVGVEYEHARSERERRAAELNDFERRMADLRQQHAESIEVRARAQTEAQAAERQAAAAQESCASSRAEMHRAVSAPGYLAALGSEEAAVAQAEASRGAEGLAAVLDCVERIVGDLERTGPDAPQADVSLDGVMQSLQQRRDALGGGWDAQSHLPHARLPLRIEVTGPLGRSTLADAHRDAQAQLRQMAGLLDRKQQDALRELLEGLIANEIALKMHSAKRMVDLMNRRLGSVSTAHRVGVRLRWRRSQELEPATARMVDLLAKQPDLRTPEQNDEVRAALSQRLADARAQAPEAAYRELIAETLDYKRWHDLDIMLSRPEAPTVRLSRRTPLSEGEKKLVTYLPLFVAVAASCDAMAEAQGPSAGDPATIARFVLLDDAFAKVSADNHAALFGLLVELDLDFIATSERLWGDHATLPALSIVEIVRDSALRTILLDRYSWHGHSLEPAEAA